MKVVPLDRPGQVRLLTILAIFVLLGIVFHTQTYFLFSRTPVLIHYFSYTPREGDVIFQSLPRGDLVNAIEGITHSPYSHCGVVVRNEKNQWVVIESIFNVHETPLFLWEFRGRGGSFDVYRVDPQYAQAIPVFKTKLLGYLGHPYDYDYADITTGRAVYCSDLVYLAFDQAADEKMGKLEKLGDLDWQPFEQFIKSDQGGRLPLDRIMITPASLSRAPQLHAVYQNLVATPSHHE